MSKNPEHELDLLIDTLNREKEPKQATDEVTAEMLAVVKTVRGLRPPAEPEEDLPENLYHNPETGRQAGILTKYQAKPARYAAIAAGLFLVVALALLVNFLNNNVVYAMDKAVKKLESYHGMVMVTAENMAGEKWMVRQVEIWSEGDRYAQRQNDGTETVNNGERKWQVRTDKQEIALLPLAPDYTRQGLDLRAEAGRLKQYPYSVMGQEMIAGRQTTKLAITPPGGDPYYLWVDSGTDLPLQLRTARQNALQTTYTFSAFEPNISLDPQIFQFHVPEGFRVVEEDPGQLVASVHEAAAVSGFVPAIPGQAPDRIFSYRQRIVLDYGDTVITESPAQGPFQPAAQGAVGKAGSETLEIVGERLRWRQQGLEIMVEGPQREKLALEIAPDLTWPEENEEAMVKPEVAVEVDMEILKADQKQVDGGHSPWQLDPLQVSLTFVNLQISPGGIVGEPKIPYTDFCIVKNNGKEALVAVATGPIRQVYLKRLVRQDESGIWAVVGYDPR